MTPNYLRGFVSVFGAVFGLIAVTEGLIPYLKTGQADWGDALATGTIGGVFLGVGVCVMFTPRKIEWNDEGVTLRANFPSSGTFAWNQLEAYSTWGNRFTTFLLKFEGVQSYQIAPFSFRTAEWKAFQAEVRRRFPEKGAWLWLGPKPIRFGKK